ncbi:MAG: hypothetical protein ACYCO9_03965 [Streptosporangiaceae bacterium]
MLEIERLDPELKRLARADVTGSETFVRILCEFLQVVLTHPPLLLGEGDL